MKHLFALLVICCAADMIRSQTMVQKTVVIPAQYQHFFDSTLTVTIDDRYTLSLYYIGALQRPRFMAQGPNGTIYIADMGAKRVFALRDINNDGIADTAVAVTPEVDSAHSIAFYKQFLLVAEPSRVRKFEDVDGDGFYETEHPFISGIGASGPYNHFTRTLLLDTTAGYLYLTVGASCNACRETDSERAVVLRYNLDGTGKEIFASGLRNAIGITKGADGNIWITNADRDRLSDSLPPEIITHIHEGGFYGWPLAYGHSEWVDFNASAEYTAMLPLTGADSARTSSMDIADVFIPPHSTPMGIVYYQDPATSRSLFYVAIHGSSPAGKTTATGYKVIEIDRTLSGWSPRDLVSGFLTDTVNYTFWARPCGLLLDTSSKVLYLSSDIGTPAVFTITPAPQIGVNLKERSASNIRLYPNPAHTSITVSVPTSIGLAHIELFDPLGRHIPYQTLSTTSNNGSVSSTIEPYPVSSSNVLYCNVTSENSSVTMLVLFY